ncbi:cysteine desulfurase family protein [Belliella baltica DSM 15883]|uniref:cysteine desulfurase n=1 Tax=Belliella baltica (strain DSM 15883 / CIP 108006 / LMG 21964 / BA134) TaxID=866536 RepID=I3Z2X4_BELBD|nr:cysteine desulfurase family protein [Belliella baltica]AFL83592.1 cysteine desulfurase family protein [Belliella baltica DSM 15883]
MQNNLIYLDNNSTTPLDPRVLESMMPYLTTTFGNASSNHIAGVMANRAVNSAREKVANLINSDPHEIIFTSGATEAINLAIKGIVEQNQDKGNHIVTVSTEHPAVLDTSKYLESKDVEITYLPVDKFGLVDLAEVEKAIRKDTILVSVMLVNNETGVIQPIKEIAELAHQKGAFFMTDATQAVGKMKVSVNEMGIDIMAFSGHKFYGPKGVGGLYLRSRRPYKVKLESLIHGGGHERGVRSGTLNVPGIVGLGVAAEISMKEMEADQERIGDLRDQLEKTFLGMPDTFLNGHPKKRLYNVSNICFKGADADAIIAGLENIAVSNGSACSSIKVEPSHVLTAMGLSESEAYSSLRLSLGRFTNYSNIDISKTKIIKEIHTIKNFSSFLE